MYIDGPEREDIVQYRNEFLKWWVEYERRKVTYGNDADIVAVPQGCAPAGGHFYLILVTYDESTFYANYRCKTKWIHPSQKASPIQKGEGASLMVSDFLTPEWGWLMHKEK